jgi:alpha-mannosidase
LEDRKRKSQGDVSLTAANAKATYNWDVGAIERDNNDERKFEVPSHQWFDLTDRSGTFGVTILSDCKYGSDKPDDKTLRLTLLRTPGIAPRAGYADQSTQDWGDTRLFTVSRHTPAITVVHRLTGTRNV